MEKEEQKQYLIDIMKADEEAGLYEETNKEGAKNYMRLKEGYIEKEEMTSERIKEIQEETAYPDSVSVKQALLKVWNECAQDKNKFTEEDLREAFSAGCAFTVGSHRDFKQTHPDFNEWLNNKKL